MAALLQITELTIRAWVNRGIIAAWYCEKICEIPAVKRMGFTKEKLRPDVDVWRLHEID